MPSSKRNPLSLPKSCSMVEASGLEILYCIQRSNLRTGGILEAWKCPVGKEQLHVREKMPPHV